MLSQRSRLTSLRCFTTPARRHARRVSFASHQTSLLGRNAPVDVHPEVQAALDAQAPVVALETTIITHGMPYPTNLETARSVERIVRSTGSIPATIGVIAGRIKIGLEPAQLELLADTKSHSSVVKISRRDIGPALALKRDGGTTCSATLIFAALAGIKVFATGGLGGVHRGGENTMDVSADLHELTRCPVGLVSAGVKSILDIGRTLEYLETLGVPVLSYAKTDDFPAFFSPRSGFKAPWRVDNPRVAAEVLFNQWQLGMQNGALFGVPIPEEFEAVGITLQEAVERALLEAERQGINKLGKEATPWLLRRVGELTEGKSLASNIALIENTALVGGQIAVQYAKLVTDHNGPQRIKFDPMISPSLNANPRAKLTPAKLLVIGSAAVDITAQAAPSPDSLGLHSTSPGTVSLSLGGVGRNIAEATHRVMSGTLSGSSETLLISPIGDDAFGRLLVDETQQLGMRTDGLMATTQRTAVCNMVMDDAGSLVGGVADMEITRSLTGDLALEHVNRHNPNIVALDGNLSPQTLQILTRHCFEKNIDVFFEPTSVAKSNAILPAIAHLLDAPQQGRAPVAFTSPNMLELAHMYHATREGTLMDHKSWWTAIDSFSLGSEFRMDLEHLAKRSACEKDSSKGTLSFLVDKGLAQMAVNLLPFFQHIIVKCGSLGVIVALRISGSNMSTSDWAHERSNVHDRYVVAKSPKDIIILQHFPPLAVEAETIINVTGSGDSLVGSILASLLKNPRSFEDRESLRSTIDAAQRAAVLTLRSNYAVSPHLSSIAQ